MALRLSVKEIICLQEKVQHWVKRKQGELLIRKYGLVKKEHTRKAASLDFIMSDDYIHTTKDALKLDGSLKLIMYFMHKLV